MQSAFETLLALSPLTLTVRTESAVSRVSRCGAVRSTAMTDHNQGENHFEANILQPRRLTLRVF